MIDEWADRIEELLLNPQSSAADAANEERPASPSEVAKSDATKFIEAVKFHTNTLTHSLTHSLSLSACLWL